MAAWIRLAWNGSSVMPLLVVPSGNTATTSPRTSASRMWCTTRSASRRESRSMYSVPAPVAIMPIMGQRLTSDFETKRQ